MSTQEPKLRFWEYEWLYIWLKGGLLSNKHLELALSDRTLKGKEVKDFLNLMGQIGWELIAVVPQVEGHGASGSSTDGYMLWFKREIKWQGAETNAAVVQQMRR